MCVVLQQNSSSKGWWCSGSRGNMRGIVAVVQQQGRRQVDAGICNRSDVLLTGHW